jgi:hypothetical protein
VKFLSPVEERHEGSRVGQYYIHLSPNPFR